MTLKRLKRFQNRSLLPNAGTSKTESYGWTGHQGLFVGCFDTIVWTQGFSVQERLDLKDLGINDHVVRGVWSAAKEYIVYCKEKATQTGSFALPGTGHPLPDRRAAIAHTKGL
jgi:hypothetical protein